MTGRTTMNIRIGGIFMALFWLSACSSFIARKKERVVAILTGLLGILIPAWSPPLQCMHCGKA